ncbi:polysaccharide deacetylase family protein [Kitasatospora sp. MAP5-34]|uniref:polysaccharide deacetylase family protein n=1 Tax=Kitasatospora sp. MAP5-34 TaxID=3035102 RepID=UPI0024744DBC|nr:polysaccharide deacetylase family protein [Kitasatospora sp. MAP5-34]MDH6575828.1 peptidoglycan/xylan/chitin deacetylase (PgdA/CDA1 family) [Kitasatospora sp. MAP5-34]
MTVDRRTVLRSTARLAALTATGALIAACDDSASETSHGPASYAAPGQPPHLNTAGPAATGLPAAPSRTPTAPATAGATAAPPLAVNTPDEVVNGPRDRREVALTFHGQGDPALATALLAAAEKHGARLTVLAVGSWLDQQPQMARRILDGGHELGNHTQNHLDISTMTAAQAQAEITQCAERLQKLTGSIGRWFRPSAAQYATPMVREQAKLVGYQHCLSYDVDPRDYTDPGADVLQRRLLKAVSGGSVVALHMGHRGTVEALPGILDGLAKLGLSAVTASQLCA